MNEKIIKCFDNFQIADFDDDMIGICKAIVDFLVEIRKQVDINKLPPLEQPDNFYKLQPHQPRMELRKNYRSMLGHAVKFQNESDEEIKLINIYVTLLACCYIYHLPAAKMVELSQISEITRDQAQEILLADNMSPNWIKEPSGSDFSAIML